MRKIALISMVMITLTAMGCSKESSDEPSERSQMAPASSSQEAAPAPAPAAGEQTAPMSGDSMSKDMGKDKETGD